MMESPPVGGPRSKREFDLPTRSDADVRRASSILTALRRRHPDARCELDARNPHELLVATILSAQATDVGVNKATPGLFAAFPTPADYAAASPAEIEPHVRTLNFWRNKAKSVHGAMTIVTERHGGVVPSTMEDLLELPGVARKTANVVLGNAFGINHGVVVDTHVGRLSRRFGLVEADEEDPKRIERHLMALFPRPSWCLLSHLFIFHGRRVCKARGASCGEDALCRRWCSNARA
jgi:endonuclease III